MTQSCDHSHTRLPIEWAFVVQLYDDPNSPLDTLLGRVEHVTSGKTLRFHNWQELQTFITQLVDYQNGNAASIIKNKGAVNV